MLKVLETITPERDDQFTLCPCIECPGGVPPLYEKYETPEGIRWRVRCPSCGANTGPQLYAVRHDVQLAWNKRWYNARRHRDHSAHP